MFKKLIISLILVGVLLGAIMGQAHDFNKEIIHTLDF